MEKQKTKLSYLPLEPLKARYTELLSCEGGWFELEAGKHFNVNPVRPGIDQTAMQINTGRVLDSVNRPIWAMKQMVELLTRESGGQVYFDDFFHPGAESLAYTGQNWSAYAFCWAQTFDSYDFTRSMVSFMRPYEAMMFSVYRKTFVASPLLQDMIRVAFPSLTENEVPCVGLPFNSENVRSIFDPQMQVGPYDVVFSSRFDTEKQPGFFLNVVEALPELKFAICTGRDSLVGNDYASVARAQHLANQGRLVIHAGLSKPEYYSVLKASKIQFNCSLQDWVSFTLLEAITHGCIPVYPNFRDFSIVFGEAPEFLYSPRSVDDAAALIKIFAEMDSSAVQRRKLKAIVEYHDGTLGRIASHLLADR